MSADRPVAIITGTSRDVGEYTAIGLEQAGWDVLGLHRDPRRAQEQANVISRDWSFKTSRMVALTADLLDESTPGQIADMLDKEFGGKANALVINAAGGYGKPLEEAREINVNVQLRLVDELIDNLADDSVIVYNNSYPAHRFGLLPESERELLGKYHSVAQTHYEGEQAFRSRIPEFSERGIRLAIVVGNGLEGSFVTGVLKGKNKNFVTQMLGYSESGYFPTVMDMAVADIKVVRSKLPTGHTEYVGISPEYQLYPSRPLGLSLVGAPEMREGSILSREQIEATIPHRWPFMFIGGVSEIEYGRRAVGSLVDLTHPDINWRGGHFPGYPLVPGVITQEALQQLGALTVLGLPQHRGKLAILAGADDMRYKNPIVPGEAVKLEAEGMTLREMRDGNAFGKGHVRALNDAGAVAVEGDISFFLKKV